MSKKKVVAAQIICTFMLVLMLGMSAFAAKVTAPKFGKVTLYGGGTGLAMLSREETPLKVSNVKIANKKIATVSIVKDSNPKSGTYDVLYVEPVKKGTTTLSFKLNINGKKKSYKVKIQVKGYVNPFGTLKVGSVNYASRYNSAGSNNYIHTSSAIKGKLSIKLKKGWELTPATGIYTGNIYGGELLKAVKNNTSIAVGNGQYLKISIYNPAAQYATEYMIAVLPKPEKKVTAPSFPKEQITLPVMPGNYSGWLLNSKEGYPLEVKDVKSSNTKVAGVKINVNGDNYGKVLAITPKKAGTAKITFKLKINGTWKAYTMKIKAFKYQNPFSSIKIGNSKYTSKFNKTNSVKVSAKQLSGKLRYKLKKGYKVDNIVIVDDNSGQLIKGGVKNNSKITLKKGNLLVLVITNTKQKYSIGYAIKVK